MFMESWILPVSCKSNVKLQASLTLKETQSINDFIRAELTLQMTSIYDSMNIAKIEFIS